MGLQKHFLKSDHAGTSPVMVGHPIVSRSPECWKSARTILQFFCVIIPGFLGHSHPGKLDAVLMPWLKERTQEELYHGAQELRIPFGKVMDSKQILNHSHLKSRRYFIEIEHPATGRITYPGAPFRFGDMPYRVNRAPLLGEHNREIYCERLGYSREELVQLRQLRVI